MKKTITPILFFFIFILNAYGNTPTNKQVEIEVKFLEVHEDALEELGLSRGPSAVTTTILTGFDARMIITALLQHKSADLMTAPRVVVLEGKPATMSVSQTVKYATSYSDIKTKKHRDGTVTTTPGTPQGDFKVADLGVSCDVTADIDDDGRITLKLNPKVTEFEGYIEYGGQSVGVSDDVTITMPNDTFMPVFSVREVQKEVTIYDGATVMFNGFTHGVFKRENNKTPIPEDIPSIGSFSRSKAKARATRHMLVFVSANIISPEGEHRIQIETKSLFEKPIIITPGDYRDPDGHGKLNIGL